MYAAGLTVGEIAEHCHTHDNTVRQHLAVRERHVPGVRAEHDVAIQERAPGWPTTSWRRRLAEAQAFTDTHGRLPGSRGDVSERSLYKWLSAQRKEFRDGALTPAKIVRLDTIGEWRTPAHQGVLDARWNTRLAQLIDYVAQNENMPRWRHHTTGREHTLGVWLHIQHQARLKKTLLPHREADLDAAVPGWRSRE
ncbi:hypothetical protein AOC05_04860 [Arthrobacter alpinus]|uniref:Helicase-associated domain-containing protein n=2 Tax=Arthrobacter alpinus TaxID=656366 RepID=A0A0M3UFR7_9MICC|nr:hypothetical protein AOC05_04860 [Arthrobacter alpinus]